MIAVFFKEENVAREQIVRDVGRKRTLVKT